MFIFTTRFSRKKALLVLVIFLAAAVLLFFLFKSPAETSDDNAIILQSNEDRITYLHSLGWEIAPEPLETLQLLLPETLPENYIAYNQIQLAQGFDLQEYCGKPLTRYTYRVTNYPGYPENVQLNLYICGDQLAAGDIISSGTNGFQSGLLFPVQKPQAQ